MICNDMIISLPKPPALNSLYRLTSIGGYARMYKTRKAQDWIDNAIILVKQAAKHYELPLKRNLDIHICVWYCGLWDVDAPIKVMLDMLQEGGIIENDKQVVSVTVDKLRVDHRKEESVRLVIDEVNLDIDEQWGWEK